MKDLLVFDVNNTDDDRDNVGAFLRSSDGTLITHTSVGGKEALDVRVAEGIDVEVDLDHTDDSVRLGDGTTLTTVTSNGGKDGLDVFIINDDIAVTATDLDIRDLDAAQDSVQSNLYDGAGTALTSTLEGSKQSFDVFVANDISVNDAALANTAIANAATTLTTADTAQDVVASPLTDRKYLWIYNNDNRRIFIGSSGVSTTDGFPLSAKNVLMLRAGAAVDVEFVGSSGDTPEIRTLELS
jgi:hypothetical protein